MRETPEDMDELRDVLQRSYGSAGEHLLAIHSEQWRLGAEQVVDRMQGMVILSLATVSPSGQAVLAPVDGMFYRGRFWFGSAPTSVRAKHIKRNPKVSAGHIKGEELSVTVVGTALEVDKGAERSLGFRDYAISIYGKASIDHFWNGDAVYWELEPRKMFALAPGTGEGR